MAGSCKILHKVGWITPATTPLTTVNAAALQFRSDIKRLSIDQMTHPLASPVCVRDIYLLQCFYYPYCPAETTASINWLLPVCSQGGIATGYPEDTGSRQGRRWAISPVSSQANNHTHLHSQCAEPPQLQMRGHRSTKLSNLRFS